MRARPAWATDRLRLAAGDDAPAVDAQLAAALGDVALRAVGRASHG